MNPDTGRIYTSEELAEAPESVKRKSVPITDNEERSLRSMNRHERRAWAKANLSRQERMRRRRNRSA
jgi:hypothetical protein